MPVVRVPDKPATHLFHIHAVMHMLIHSSVHNISPETRLFEKMRRKCAVYHLKSDALYRASAIGGRAGKPDAPNISSVSLVLRKLEDTAGTVGQEWWDG